MIKVMCCIYNKFISICILEKEDEKTQNLSEEAGYQKDINKILIKKVRDIEKLNETLELTMVKIQIEPSAKYQGVKEEAVIGNTTITLKKSKINTIKMH